MGSVDVELIKDKGEQMKNFKSPKASKSPIPSKDKKIRKSKSPKDKKDA